jgi:serine/threonine protein kinase
MASAPFRLHGFEPIERLGGGGFGEVWLARQTNIDRMVAVKIGHMPIDDKTVQLRFERECIALGRLSGHRNIIDVFTAGQLEDGRPYLVLEYISGGTMWQRVHKDPMGEPELIRIGIQLAGALSIAHEAGVLHRDLKPENVLLRLNGEVVLGDFGIARLHDGANTTSQAIAASVAYAAPEILSGKPATIAADVYGLGICLLAAILRSVPFVENTDESIHPIINRVLSNRPPDIRQYGISDQLATLIEQLLAKEPSQRPASATEVRHRLEQLSSGSSPSPAPSHAPPDQAAGATRAVGPIPSLGSLPPPPVGSQPPAGTPSNPHFQPIHQVSPAAPPPIYQVSPAAPPPIHQVSPAAPPPIHQVSPAAPPPTQHRPYTISGPQPFTPTGGGSGGGGHRARMFVIAFGGTLVIGGLLLLLIIRLAGDGGDTAGTTTTAGLTSTTPSAGSSTSDLGGLGSTSSTTAATLPTGSLALPLTVADLPVEFGDAPGIDPDTIGPDSPQFCENTPVTAGITDWVGETITESTLGSPLLFQELVRFETSNQASAYVASYMATVNCSEWTQPESVDGPAVLFRPVTTPAVAVYGDDTREITFEAESVDAAFVVLYGRVALVRYGTDVYTLNLTSFLESEVDQLDGLLQLAVQKLGY